MAAIEGHGGTRRKPMRTITLIAAGLATLVAAAEPAQAQYYGYPAYPPYYGYYPPQYYYPPHYYPPPIIVYVPVYRPMPTWRPHVARHATRRRARAPGYRLRQRHLVNPLLGPLPDLTRRR